MKKTSLKDNLLLLLVIPVALFVAFFTLAELFGPIKYLADSLEDNWGLTTFQACSLAFGWLFWLLASIFTATSISKDGHETLSVVLGISTALLAGVLLNLLLAECCPVFCGILSLLYLGIMLFYRWYQFNRK